MMTKYHINKKGKPSVCRAMEGNCPLGGLSGTKNHFETLEEALKFIQKNNMEEFGLIPGMPENQKVKEYRQIPNSPNEDLGLSPAAHQVLEKQMVVLREKLDPSKFKSVGPNPGINKPLEGGFWTSTANPNGESEWTDKTRREMFYRNYYKKVTHDIAEIHVSPDAKVLTIDNEEDFVKILKRYKEPEDKYKSGEGPVMVTSFRSKELLDFDLLSKDYDAIRVTQNGINENYESFEKWEVESTLWFNIDKFESVDYKEKGYKEKKVGYY